MGDSTGHSQINEAIVRMMRSYWSAEVAQKIEIVYGKDVALKTKAIYDAAIDCPVDWGTATMDSALGILADYLTELYPWLSPEAKTHLNHCYIMTWK